MRKIILVAGLVLMATGAQARSVWDGVYTEDQAARGQTAYRQNCGRCHGPDLSGTFEVPPLVGRFATYWSGSTVDVLVNYITHAMPLGRPGSLSPATNADITAFLLKSNGFPAGSKELSAESKDQKFITFDAIKKKRAKAQ